MYDIIYMYTNKNREEVKIKSSTAVQLTQSTTTRIFIFRFDIHVLVKRNKILMYVHEVLYIGVTFSWWL